MRKCTVIQIGVRLSAPLKYIISQLPLTYSIISRGLMHFLHVHKRSVYDIVKQVSVVFIYGSKIVDTIYIHSISFYITARIGYKQNVAHLIRSRVCLTSTNDSTLTTIFIST